MLTDSNSSSYVNLPLYNRKFFDYFGLGLGPFPLYKDEQKLKDHEEQYQSRFH